MQDKIKIIAYTTCQVSNQLEAWKIVLPSNDDSFGRSVQCRNTAPVRRTAILPIVPIKNVKLAKKNQATTFPPDNCVLRFRFADGVFSQELESFLKEYLIFYVTKQLFNS